MTRARAAATRRCAGGLCAGVLLLAGVGPAGAQVLMREGAGELKGAVADVSAGGVTIDIEISGKPARRVVGWDRVKGLPGESAGRERPFAAFSDRLWRARSRLERGDWMGAEPLLDRLEADAAEASGPSAAVVFEGLLRCRLARGARAGAVNAWLGLLRLYDAADTSAEGGWSRPAAWIGGVIGGAPTVDARLGLVPALPPIWVGETAMDVAGSTEGWPVKGSDSEAATSASAAACAEIGAWYAVAARFEAGLAITGQGGVVEWPTARGNLSGVRLVRLIVQGRTGDAAQREAAREALRGVMGREGIEPWEEAWCRAGIGRSLLRESEPEKVVRGVVELLHVPARLSAASPHLAACGLAEASAAMADAGDQQAAWALKQDLLARFPLHPAAEWSRLQTVRAPQSTEPAAKREKDELPVTPKAATPKPSASPPQRGRR